MVSHVFASATDDLISCSENPPHSYSFDTYWNCWQLPERKTLCRQCVYVFVQSMSFCTLSIHLTKIILPCNAYICDALDLSVFVLTKVMDPSFPQLFAPGTHLQLGLLNSHKNSNRDYLWAWILSVRSLYSCEPVAQHFTDRFTLQRTWMAAC